MTTPNDIFKRNQHPAIMAKKLLSFYKNREFFDTQLIAGPECTIIHANRNVLAATSEYFLETYGDPTQSKGDQIELKNIDATTLQLIVDFIYSGWIELNLKNAESVLRTAQFLKIRILIDGCCDFIEKNIDTSNCWMWFSFSKELGLSELRDASLKYMCYYFEDISKKKQFLMLDEMELKDLLFTKIPNADSQEHFFLGIVAWIEFDKANREHLLFQLLSMLRHQFLTPEFINKNRNLVCTNFEISELVDSWQEWHLSCKTGLVTDTNNDESCISKPNRGVEDKLTAICLTSSGEIVIQTYNPELDSWFIEKQTCILERKCYQNLIVIDEKLIFGGKLNENLGNTIECLDLVTLKWTDLPPMLNSKPHIIKLANIEGHLCVFTQNDPKIKDSYCSLEIYNFSMNEWKQNIMTRKSESFKICAHNGLLYIVDFGKNCLESYDVSSNEWTSKEFETEQSDCLDFVGCGQFLYIIGSPDDGTNFKRYDILEDTLCDVAPLPQSETSIKAEVFGNKIIVFQRRNTLMYNPDTDTWETLGPLAVRSIFEGICIYTSK